MLPEFTAPRHLEASSTPISHVTLIGGCIFDVWIDAIGRVAPDINIQHYLFQHAMQADADLGQSDLRLAQVPLRAIIPEHLTMPLNYRDVEAHDALFGHATRFLRAHVEAISQKPLDAPTFFLNYLVPQQNPLGRLMPRYDLRNPVYFIEELNRALYDIVSGVPNSYVLDIAQISASVGRQHFQDDPFHLLSHGSFVTDFDYNLDQSRLDAGRPLTELYDFAVRSVVESFWNEAVAMYRTLRATDRVKMLCIDLDDTLWRGVMAEEDDVDPGMLEGWPIALAEALAALKNRGIILAIISKNDEARVREIWAKLFSGKLMLEDFAICKISWQPKAEALAEAIAQANILPDSVVFLDDNPIERAQIKAAHPLVRVIEAAHLDWRRILLWSPEMQVDIVTDESLRRNEMVKGQVLREDSRQKLDREQFLNSLDLRAELTRIETVDHPQFARALELVNKTNQFNTTGKRWTIAEAGMFLSDSGQWVTFKVSDRYTNYGLVGVLMVKNGEVEQFVMSCRVFGLGIELAVLAKISQDGPLSASIVETPKNGPSRLVFREAGWEFDGETWHSGANSLPAPPHVLVS